MTEQEPGSLITDEMRAEIGRESEPWTLAVDQTGVQMFARAVGHTDPVFYDEAKAKEAGYRGLPTPPGYLGTPLFDPRTSDPTFGVPVTDPGPQPKRPLGRILNGGTEIELLEDICVGDVLTARSHISSLDERKGGLGEMLFTTTKTVYKNQAGRTVAVVTGTAIRY